MAGLLLPLSQWEGQFLVFVQEVVRHSRLTDFFTFYTRLGDHGLLWIALCALLLLHPKTRRAGAAGAVALLLSFLLTNVLLKHLVQRTRPWLILEELLPLVHEPDPNSFPSGHTSAAFGAATAWARTLPKRWMRVTGLVMAALMALSRLYVGVHFPTDVFFGFLVGSLCGLLGWRLENLAEEAYKNKRDGSL